MYTEPFSRQNPGCIVILLDRSESMRNHWAGSNMTLAEGATQAVNQLLFDLIVKSTKEHGQKRHYFDIGIFGYGVCPISQTEGVESALGGALTGRGIVPLPELAENPLTIREVPSIDAQASSLRVPVWIEPVHGYRTPMCQAIAEAGWHINQWAEDHLESFPPIVINITDGMVTDSPYDGASLSDWAKRLYTIPTCDGETLLLNVFLSPSQDPAQWFPATPVGLPEPGPELFEISSTLPPKMADNARAAGVDIQPGSRGLLFNADLNMLIKFLEIGTHFPVKDR